MTFWIKPAEGTVNRSLRRRGNGGGARLSSVVLAALLAGMLSAGTEIARAPGSPTHSTTIALTPDETRLVVVNREANSVSIIQVKDNNGNDVANKLAEIAVGQEPRCVAVHPNGQVAYVTNAITGTVSVVDLLQYREAGQILVGTEPRGCGLTPNGSLLYVANHTEGTVSVLAIPSGNPLNPVLDGAVKTGGNPTAIAVTDTTVFVTNF